MVCQVRTLGTAININKLWEAGRLPRAYPWTLYGERCHSNKCQLLQLVKKWTEAGYPLQTERKVDTGCSAVTWQCMPSYGTPHHQHHSATELEVLVHPAYSPDLAPSDFHLFGPLKNALRGHWFAADDEVKEVVHDWLRSQPQTFFSNGIKKLTDRWAKCIKKKGEYIEK